MVYHPPHAITKPRQYSPPIRSDGYGQVYVLDFDTSGEDGKMRILPITVGLQNHREGEMFSEWQMPKFRAVGVPPHLFQGQPPLICVGHLPIYTELVHCGFG